MKFHRCSDEIVPVWFAVEQFAVRRDELKTGKETTTIHSVCGKLPAFAAGLL